jgi:hypothetical protein
MIFIHKLDKRTSKLSEIVIYQICQFFAGQHSLLLQNADIAPGINYSGLYIPEGSVTKEISVIVKKSRRSHHLSVAGTLDVHHLSRFGTDEYDKTVRLVLLGIGGNRGCESH